MKSNIEQSPGFSKFMRIFDEMRAQKGEVNYKELHRAILRIDPSISYWSVFTFFKKFQDRYLIKKEIQRADLREKKKRIAADALKEVEENPSLLKPKERIALGKEATTEELQEVRILLSEKHKQKEESMLERLIDQARYGGDVIDVPATEKVGTLPNPEEIDVKINPGT